MSIIYLNGEYLPKESATVSVEDRGFLLADGVYEVVRVYNGKSFTLDRHLARLRRSLAAVRLAVDVDHLPEVTMELLRRNELRDARIYWQVTRGPAPRDHAFPPRIKPTILAMADPAAPLTPDTPLPQCSVLLTPDRRWLDCGIKSLMLLPNVLARQLAVEAGCGEAILHRGSLVTEGAATSVFAVFDGELHTHPADGTILAGVTRAVVIELAQQLGIALREEAFTVDDLPRASELLLTGTTTHVAAITRCVRQNAEDEHTYFAGPIAQQLHEVFVDAVLNG